VKQVLVFVATVLGSLLGIAGAGDCCEWFFDSLGRSRSRRL